MSIGIVVLLMSSNITLLDTASYGGFLSGFVETSIEKPADGLNGECFVHYGGDHTDYEMRVKLVNGVREGKAIILNDGVPFIIMEYNNGSLTGSVEKLDDFGVVELRGHLVNGNEEGLFEELDRKRKVIWTGYYKKGKRYVGAVRKVSGDGRYDGSGEYYIFDESGSVSQLCLFENGMKSRVLARFCGNIMTELDGNEKRIYEGEFEGDTENGYVRSGKGKEFANGNRMALYSGNWKNGRREGFGTEYKEFKPFYTGEWENGKRNGEGEELDENGRVVYEGKWKDGVIEELKIDDGVHNNPCVTELKLSGLDQLKRIVMGDESYKRVVLFEIDGLNLLESIVIGKKCFTIATIDGTAITWGLKDGTLRISNCPKLKSIQIGDNSFASYRSFELKNLPSLQSIDIGEYCFSLSQFLLTGLIDWFA